MEAYKDSIIAEFTVDEHRGNNSCLQPGAFGFLRLRRLWKTSGSGLKLNNSLTTSAVKIFSALKKEKKLNLKCMRRVVDAVDAEAVVEGQAGHAWGEQRQLQAFAGRLRGAGLAHQTVRSQLLHQNMTALLLQLQVARGRQGLLSDCQHLLKIDTKKIQAE